MRRVTLEISAEEQLSLEKAVRTHRKPYVRERAYALLKVASGMEIQQVATLLMQKRQPRTVSDWVKRYKSEGFKGLEKHPGSGRKAAFFPSKPTNG